MGKASLNPAIEVSVSFGRFENDSLCWEKWSSFSPNKHLEEVEKCAVPGSVAQKKAYFEAHYRKIAARKAEEVDQKHMKHESLRSEDANGEDLIEKTRGTDFEFDISCCINSAEGITQETEWDSDHLGDGRVDEPNENAALDAETRGSLEAQDFVAEKAKEELRTGFDSPMLDKPSEVSLTKGEENPVMGYQDRKELPKNFEKEKERIPMIKEENVRPHIRKESRKIAPMSNVIDVTRVKKKLESPVTKPHQTSTPKVSKPVPTSAALPTPRSSTRKVTGSSLSRSKHLYVGENKIVAPKSLHMSLSLDPTNPNPATASARKSFIMEDMKDKDIVKQAFKTFEHNSDQLKSSAVERSLRAKQAPMKETEVKVSTSVTARKENAGSLKANGTDKKTAKAAPSFLSPKSEERAERKKEKLEEISDARAAESTRPKTKSKCIPSLDLDDWKFSNPAHSSHNEKEADTKKLIQSINFKATPLPSFYRGQKASKIPLDKVGSKTLGI